MKPFLLITLLTFFFSCKNDSKTADIKSSFNDTIITANDENKAINSLKDFYFSVYDSDKNNDILKKKFLSERVLKKINSLTSDPTNLILDYDPFIKGQDYDGNVIKKTLEIKSLNKPNEYRVSFLVFRENNEYKTNIDFLMKKNEDGEFLIDAILNDEYLNFRLSNENKLDKDIGKYKLIKENIADLNQDGIIDKISVYKTEWSTEINPFEPLLFKTKVELSKFKGIHDVYENNKIIYPYYSDNVASGFSDIKVKNNYFTIEQTNSSGNYIERSYTTFKYDDIKRQILFHKYSTITTERSSGDENEKNSEYSEKDLGKITFKEFDPLIIHKEIISKP